jgi:hypothetical protein
VRIRSSLGAETFCDKHGGSDSAKVASDAAAAERDDAEQGGLVPKSTRPHRVRRRTWKPKDVEAVLDVRRKYSFMGKARIQTVLVRKGRYLSVSTVADHRARARGRRDPPGVLLRRPRQAQAAAPLRQVGAALEPSSSSVLSRRAVHALECARHGGALDHPAAPGATVREPDTYRRTVAAARVRPISWANAATVAGAATPRRCRDRTSDSARVGR